jgi:hypothetical protein
MADQHQGETTDGTAALPRSRALAVIEIPLRSQSDERPEAVFLTQLIACERRLPAYRQARKAEPNAATAAYGQQAGFAPARLNYII